MKDKLHILTILLIIFFSNIAQAADDLNYYKLLIGKDFKDIATTTKDLSKGTIIYIHDNRIASIIPKICDYNQPIIITDGTVTCFYVGHVRKFNFRRVYDGELLTK